MPFFLESRRNERGVATLHERLTTKSRGKMAPARRVAPKIVPCVVARRSFTLGKPHSSRLAGHDFGWQLASKMSVNTP